MTKECSRCKIPKPTSEFSRRSDRGNGKSLLSKCDSCRAELTEKWREQNSEEMSAFKRRWLLRRYGLTEADYTAMGDACWICGTTDPGPGRKNFDIDHDHACCPGRESCGKCIRGKLCSRCNKFIGTVQDNPELLRKAATYLEKWQAEQGRLT